MSANFTAAPIAPYLPGNWTRGAGVNSLTFRHFLTHRSGFGQIGAGSSYNDLRTAIGTNVGNTSFSYSNANYGWIGGDFGTYYMHGGDWFHAAGEAHVCAVAFPIQVQAGLVINSERGADMPYQCVVLQDAFDDAWVAN